MESATSRPRVSQVISGSSTSQTKEILASHAEVDLAGRRRVPFRSPPAHEVLGIGPRFPDGFARCIEDARYDEVLNNWQFSGITLSYGMIQMAAAGVAHGSTNGLRHFADPCEQFLDRKFLKLRIAFESLIEVGDIRPVVLVMVNLHRLRVNVRLERVEGVWERRQIVPPSVEGGRGRMAGGVPRPPRVHRRGPGTTGCGVAKNTNRNSAFHPPVRATSGGGVPRIHVHGLRHTFGSQMAMAVPDLMRPSCRRR